jgi:NAD(P)H dehydrogenase (quinone)
MAQGGLLRSFTLIWSEATFQMYRLSFPFSNHVRAMSTKFSSRKANDELQFLVVHAHPDRASFSRALCDTAVAALLQSGHTVMVLDLYADQFEARLSLEERLAYETATPIIDPLVQRYADLVKSADGMVFVYPTWWWGMPAILKGFFERVFVPGVSFTLDPSSNKVEAGLSNLRHVVGISTYGSSKVAMRVFQDGGRRLVNRCIRVLAPKFRCKSTWLGLYKMDRSTQREREAFLRQVKSVMGSL